MFNLPILPVYWQFIPSIKSLWKPYCGASPHKCIIFSIK